MCLPFKKDARVLFASLVTLRAEVKNTASPSHGSTSLKRQVLARSHRPELCKKTWSSKTLSSIAPPMPPPTPAASPKTPAPSKESVSSSRIAPTEPTPSPYPLPDAALLPPPGTWCSWSLSVPPLPRKEPSPPRVSPPASCTPVVAPLSSPPPPAAASSSRTRLRGGPPEHSIVHFSSCSFMD